MIGCKSKVNKHFLKWLTKKIIKNITQSVADNTGDNRKLSFYYASMRGKYDFRSGESNPEIRFFA